MMKADTREWEKQADILARSWAPPINPCVDCGGPVLSGYCCSRCGSIDPNGKINRRPENG